MAKCFIYLKDPNNWNLKFLVLTPSPVAWLKLYALLNIDAPTHVPTQPPTHAPIHTPTQPPTNLSDFYYRLYLPHDINWLLFINPKLPPFQGTHYLQYTPIVWWPLKTPNLPPKIFIFPLGFFLIETKFRYHYHKNIPFRKLI